jgi:hypothetical protein
MLLPLFSFSGLSPEHGSNKTDLIKSLGSRDSSVEDSILKLI